MEKWRRLSGLQPNIGQVTLDAWGLKRLLSYAMRRWVTGALTPREADQTFTIPSTIHLHYRSLSFLNRIELTTFKRLDSQDKRLSFLWSIFDANWGERCPERYPLLAESLTDAADQDLADHADDRASDTPPSAALEEALGAIPSDDETGGHEASADPVPDGVPMFVATL